ncbi:hypothetical protein BN2476_360054 [Paraburkholderia piptadeniae]|uniref:Uncharacterized protein n=1 Tax=Paraburkholderia piptadeniae TaxID=1701573 RepID=A0A1N7S9A4_9BURK|nr:hypothetical protein BN2476_360054 [Paraburkholderia piptadeniae]
MTSVWTCILGLDVPLVNVGDPLGRMHFIRGNGPSQTWIFGLKLLIAMPRRLAEHGDNSPCI